MSKPAEHFFVSGIVAARDKKPYVQIATEHGIVAQLTLTQARAVAEDIQSSAGRAEADAMLHGFFAKMQFPDAALGELMVQFREFRAAIDDEGVKHTHREPNQEL